MRLQMLIAKPLLFEILQTNKRWLFLSLFLHLLDFSVWENGWFSVGSLSRSSTSRFGVGSAGSTTCKSFAFDTIDDLLSVSILFIVVAVIGCKGINTQLTIITVSVHFYTFILKQSSIRIVYDIIH